MSFFKRKSITALRAEATDKEHALKRTLGPLSLTSIGLGAIIGAGFFVLTGLAAAENAGPAVILSYILAAIICVFAAFCYAEFASLIPIAGSAYSYAYATMGEVVAWTIGWGNAMYYLFAASTVAVGWSGYLQSLLHDLGLKIPSFLSSSPLGHDSINGWHCTGSLVNLPALLIVLFVGGMISVGVKAAASLNNLMVTIKIGAIVIFILCGISFFNWENLAPFIPQNTGTFGEFGWSGILRGSGIVFFGFIGFEGVSAMAQETKNPQRNMPIGMMASLGFSAIIYIIVTCVLIGAVGYKSLGVPDPLAFAVNSFGDSFIWLRYLIKIAIVLSLGSVVLVMLMVQSRIFYSMSMDGLLPKPFCSIHKKYKTPFFTTIVNTMFVALFAGFFPVGILGQVSSMGALMAFALVSLGILILRYKQPDLKRPFKTPLVPFVPVFSVIMCIGQMLALHPVVWLQLLTWLALGYFIYFGYGYKHSLLRKG